MKRLLSILSLALLVAVVFCAGDALAVNDTFFQKARDKASDVFKNTKTIVYIVGAFGLMVIAIGAIFGKLAWKTFAYLAIGLLILVGAGAIVDYFVADSTYGDLEGNLADTLSKV